MFAHTHARSARPTHSIHTFFPLDNSSLTIERSLLYIATIITIVTLSTLSALPLDLSVVVVIVTISGSIAISVVVIVIRRQALTVRT
jgi:hypothetical protein